MPPPNRASRPDKHARRTSPESVGAAPSETEVSFCVLASGSRGNASVLRVRRSGSEYFYLIDLGLSPRRIRQDFQNMGIDQDKLRGVFLTHLDTDHFYRGWPQALPGAAPIFVHERHAEHARRLGVLRRQLTIYDGPFRVGSALDVTPTVMPHDEDGVIALRIDLPYSSGASLGFATDLGAIEHELIDGFCDVDLLALESNYCPTMQAASARPAFLKQRVMGGYGHLSNQQCAEAARLINPRDRLVLLHLSQECNDPRIAARLHAGRSYQLTVSSQQAPTKWFPVQKTGSKPAPTAPPSQLRLFART